MKKMLRIFPTMSQMKSQIVLAVLLAGILFLAYQLYLNLKTPKYVIEETFIAAAPVVTQPIPEPERVVAPGGPSSPNQLPPPTHDTNVRLPGPEDSDPLDDSYGSSNMKDNMRYPERLFGPAPSPQATSIAVSAGNASTLNSGVNVALQTFSPDFAQNGTEFIPGGIFANDVGDNPNYSAF
jgi:hypothetical protein